MMPLAIKTVNGSKTTYQYINGQLYYEKRGDGKELYYLYDSYGNLAMIRMHEDGVKSVYYVSTNWQGDVIGLYTLEGVQVAKYEYDAWGNTHVYKFNSSNYPVEITNSEADHIGNINPITFRFVRGTFYIAKSVRAFCTRR